MKIISAVGARPNFIKISSIAKAFNAYNEANIGPRINHLIVHTGQHYDNEMSKLFFDELEIPKPDYNLEVGSGSHAYQTAEIMKRFELIVLEEKPDFIIVVGDVNSTIACSLLASKIKYPIAQLTNHSNQRCRPLVAHVEAGLRSFDRSMPEEINRVLTDTIADLLSTTEESANKNLKQEGIAEKKIFFVGNVMIDTLLKHKQKAQKSDILYCLGLKKNSSTENSQLTTDYCVLTLHRPSNVDDKKTFEGILEALTVIAKDLPIIFPVHPRTLNCIDKFGFKQYIETLSTRNSQLAIRNSGIHCLDPLGYLDFLCLMSHAKLVLTDSGGIQEETTILGVPCVTLRENTERPITVTSGTNVIAGSKKEDIIKSSLSQLSLAISQLHTHSKVPLWDGMAAKRIVDVLINIE